MNNVFLLRSYTQHIHTLVAVYLSIPDKMELKNSLHYLRYIFVLILISLFLILFGYPSTKAYMQGSVVVETEYQVGEKLEFPAITFCVDAVDAWKDIDELKILTEANISHSQSIVQKRCRSSSTEDIIQCIKSKTYTLEEIVIVATSKFLNNISMTVNVMNAKFWSSSFTQPEFGTCHKFYHPPIEKDVSVSEAPQFFFTLNSSLTHNIFIHDPKFFMLMMTPSIIPGIVKVVSKPGRNSVLTWQYIATSKHVKKRRGRHDCKGRGQKKN